MENNQNNTSSENRSGRIFTGIVLLVIGLVLLAKSLQIGIPGWILTWPMLVIAISLFVGGKNNFKPGFWLVGLFVGTLFLVDKNFIDLSIGQFIVPVVLISIGAYIIFKPKKTNEDSWGNAHVQEVNKDGYWESVSIFGGNKNIITKDFRGGESVTIMGGTEINMMQADIQGKVALEITQIMGGTKLIVPSHWRIQTSEVVSILGGIDDKRPVQGNIDENKVLVISGTSILGGLEIKSY